MLNKVVAAAGLTIALSSHALAADPSANVLEIAIRSVPNQEAWQQAAIPFQALVTGETGIIGNAEFMSVMGFAPVDKDGKPVPNVFIGMMQVESQQVFDGLMAKFMRPDAPPAVGAYMATINNILDIQVQPFRETPKLDIANFVKKGQVLEIAVRDVSGLDFDAFDAKRKAFVDLLVGQPGVVGEFEYRSTDQKYYVGMTIYESSDALNALMGNARIVQGPEFGALMQSYPPMVAQYLVRIQ